MNNYSEYLKAALEKTSPDDPFKSWLGNRFLSWGSNDWLNGDSDDIDKVLTFLNKQYDPSDEAPAPKKRKAPKKPFMLDTLCKILEDNELDLLASDDCSFSGIWSGKAAYPAFTVAIRMKHLTQYADLYRYPKTNETLVLYANIKLPAGLIANGKLQPADMKFGDILKEYKADIKDCIVTSLSVNFAEGNLKNSDYIVEQCIKAIVSKGRREGYGSQLGCGITYYSSDCWNIDPHDTDEKKIRDKVSSLMNFIKFMNGLFKDPGILDAQKMYRQKAAEITAARKAQNDFLTKYMSKAKEKYKIISDV